MQAFIDKASHLMGMIIILPLIGTGIYLAIRLKLVQMLQFGHSWKVIAGVYDNPEDEGDINHLQALSAALSATIGIGNIAGVATAIYFGGPGALFWMWVTAFLGMGTKFTEATLAVKYRRIHSDGSSSGGPMYYIEKGLGSGWKPLAVIFAFCTIVSSFGSGNTVQAFTVGDSFFADFGIPQWITGLVLATLVGLVILGGIKRIGLVASRLVPFMATLYIIAALYVIFKNAAEVPAAFVLIFKSAFTPQAGAGGFLGSTFMMALLWGVRRGLFSNESGQGSAPIAHAAAKTDQSVREGTVAMIGPFIDTLVICTMTGLTIITSGVWTKHFPVALDLSDITIVQREARPTPSMEGIQVREDEVAASAVFIEKGRLVEHEALYGQGFLKETVFEVVDENGAWQPVLNAEIKYEADEMTGQTGYRLYTDDGPADDIRVMGKGLLNGSVLTSKAFESALPGRWGGYIITFGVFLFALSTAISWSYYGDRATIYLFGERGVMIYRTIFVIVIFIGANLKLQAAWGFGDIALSFMAIPNLFALVLLAKKVQKWKEEYFSIDHKPRGKAHW